MLDLIIRKGSKTYPGHYCLVRLMSVVCMVFEGFIRYKMHDYIINNNPQSKKI